MPRRRLKAPVDSVETESTGINDTRLGAVSGVNQQGSALLSVLLLLSVVSLGLSWFVYWQESQKQSSMAFKSGELFGHTVSAAHRYVRDRQQDYISLLMPGSSVPIDIDTLKAEGYLPSYLRTTNRFNQETIVRVALHPDGTPMAWVGVNGGRGGREIPGDSISAFITGAQSRGLNSGFWQSGGTSTEATTLGFATGAGMPWTTTARAISYNPDFIYRHRVPGQTTYATMRTDLELGTEDDRNSIQSVNVIENSSIDLSRWLRSNGTMSVTKDALATGNLLVGNADIINSINIGDSADISTSINSVEVDVVNDISGTEIDTNSLEVESSLTGPRLNITGLLRVEGEYRANQGVTSQTLTSTNSTFSGSITADEINTDRLSTGDLTAKTLSSPSGYSKRSTIRNMTVQTCIGCPDPGGPDP